MVRAIARKIMPVSKSAKKKSHRLGVDARDKQMLRTRFLSRVRHITMHAHKRLGRPRRLDLGAERALLISLRASNQSRVRHALDLWQVFLIMALK